MGCGSSSLKGEKVQDIKPEQGPAIKKVRTNFSDINFSGDGSNRRLTVAVAPDEQRRPTKISEAVENVEDDSTNADRSSKAAYQPVAGDTGLGSPTTERPTVQLPNDDPTSAGSKQAFTSSNEPASHQRTAGSSSDAAATTTTQTDDTLLSASNATEPRRKSWLGRLSGSGRGRKSSEISDEELQRNIGMTRAEFEEWKKDPKNKVGPKQAADNGMAHSGIGTTMAGYAT